MSDIKKAVDTLASRRDSYMNAENYYRGGEAEVFVNARWGKLLRRRGLDYVLNYSKTVVDTVLDRIEIASVAGTDEASNAAINRIWEMNELTLDANEIHKRALVYGECYAVVWPDAEGEVQITYNAPTTTVMMYDEENPRKKSYAAKLWESESVYGKKIVKMNVFYADRVEKYWRQGELNLVTTQDENSWQLSETVENPWGEVPVFHFRTHRPYGTSEHSAAIGPQDAINKIMMNHMETIDYQGAPQRFALSDGGSMNEVADFEEDDAARNNLGQLDSGPGRLWYLNGVSTVGQFNVADHKNFTEPIMVYVKAMASLTQTPLHYFQNNGQFASGEALRTAEAPLVKKVEDRQISFGATWRELFKFVLKIEGITSDVQVKWQNIESLDSTDAWNVALQKQAVGIPLLFILMEMGYDKEVAEEIVKASEEEAKKKMEAMQVPGQSGQDSNMVGMNAHNLALKAQADRQEGNAASD